MAERAAMRLIHSVYSFRSILGQSFQIEIGGIPCELMFPVAASKSALGPPLKGGWPSVHWGIDDGGTTVSIVRVGISIKEGDFRGDLNSFDPAVADWKRLLYDWLSVLVNVPTDFFSESGGDLMWHRTEMSNASVSASGALYFLGYEPKPVSEWQWRHAIEHVNAGDEPQIARLLLVKATHATAVGDWRMAVVDAATCAEVALAEGIRGYLVGNYSSTIASVLMSRIRMLGNMLKVAQELGLVVPASSDAELVQVRNRVLHKGAAAGKSEAERALAVAREIVDLYQPLAEHCHDPG